MWLRGKPVGLLEPRKYLILMFIICYRHLTRRQIDVFPSDVGSLFHLSCIIKPHGQTNHIDQMVPDSSPILKLYWSKIKL